MANTVTVTKLLDGPRNAIFHVFIQSDGASGELTDFVLIDPISEVSPALPAVPSFTVEQLVYDLTGFDAKLEFDYLLSDTAVWSMSGGSGVHLNFEAFGGLKDRSNVLDGTGKLMITTSGLTTASDNGTIIIKVRKD